MNTEKTLKNSIISIISEVLSLLLSFAGRRIFVHFLDIEFLGYQSLFGNIFSLLSVAELGIGSIISFHLFKELAEDNREEIGKLMYLYKWIYRLIAAVVLTLGLICAFAVPYIAKGATASRGYLYTIYFMQLGNIVAGYFLSYRRAIYIANQKEYKCVQVDLYKTLVIQIVQVASLALFRSYLIYLSIQIAGSIAANVIIAHGTNRDYPYLNQKYEITLSDLRRRNMFSDVRNFIVHKICNAIYGGTDNIIISAFCGVRMVALYGNYYLLQTGVLQILFYKLLNPVRATIGNIIYGNRSKAELWGQFEIFDVFSFFFASYIALGFLLFFQPAIQIWMGKQYLLPMSFVAAYSFTIYFGAVWELVYKYRSVFGDYAQDRNCMLLSAILNIAVSVTLVRVWGVTGVQLGTLAAFFPIAYGRIRFVVRGFFGKSIRKYLTRHALLSLAVLAEALLAYVLTKNAPITVLGLARRAAVWAVLPGAVGVLIYGKSPYFKGLCQYFKNALAIIKKKLTTFKMKGKA